MAAGIGLVVKIAADTAKAVGDIHDVNKALDGTGDSTKKASGMFAGLKSAALPVIGAVVAGVGVAATAMFQFAQAAIEDKQEADKLARVLETIPGITKEMVDANEDWITSTMYATHVMDTDLREAVGQLALVTGDLSTAQDYAARSADLASVANVDYQTAVAAVESALAGKTRALMALAPWLDTNKDKSLSAAEAAAILTTETLDGKAAADAAADPWTTITIIWGEMQEALGQFILPLFERLGNWFKDPANQQKIQDFIDKLAAMSQELGTKLLGYLEDFIGWLQSPDGQAAVKQMTELVKDLAAAIGQVAGAFKNLGTWYDNLPGPVKWIWEHGPGAGAAWLFGASGSDPAHGGAAGGRPHSLATSAPAGITVNFYGGIHTDPEATARAITSSLRNSDMRNARARPLTTQLEPAW